jgi:hypothetical protein
MNAHRQNHRDTAPAAQQDHDTWNGNGGNGITNDGANGFFLGYHNEQAAVNSAFKHLQQDAGNPNALKQDFAALSDAASHPGQGGNADWRHRFLGELQDKINGNSPESAAMRRAYGLQDGQNFSFDGNQSMYIPPAPYNPQRSPASALPGSRQGDSQVTPPRQTPDGFDSSGYAQNAQGGQSFFREHDYTQNGIPTKSVRTFDSPTDLKRGDQTVTGVSSEVTTRGLNGTDVTLNTDHGPVSYHQTQDGKVQFDAPTADQVGPQKAGTPFFPTGSYSPNGDMKTSPTNDNASSGWLGGSLNPFSGNVQNIAVNTERQVDANGRVQGMSVTYDHRVLGGTVNTGGGADLDGMQVYQNRNAQNASSANWGNVHSINYKWDANKGAYQMKVDADGGVKTYWTDGKKIYSDW